MRLNLLTLFMVFFLISSVRAQDSETRQIQILTKLGSDVSKPLFGKSFIPPDLKDNYSRSYFLPSVSFEFSANRRWSLGLKFGYQNYREKNYGPSNSSSPGIIGLEESQEKIVGGNIYTNYFFNSKKRLRPYLGAGIGYQRISKSQISDFPSGQRLVTKNESGEASLLAKAGIMYSFSPRFGFYSEVEYPEVPFAWVIGFYFRL